LELCEYGNLFQYLKKNGPLSETHSAFLMYQLLNCLQYLHDNEIVHRDLKLSNILIADIEADGNLRIKLCDFGLATSIEHPDEEHFTLCGTPNYIAPEIALQQAHGFPVDIWSLGCLFYSMLTGTLPFDQGGVRETLQKIMTGEYRNPENITSPALDFLNRLLELVSLSSTAYLLTYICEYIDID
jgi:polo-like kinase 4